MEPKKLIRSRYDRKLGGVCAGVANYINIDVTLVRIIWAILGFTPIGFLAYIISWVIIPEEA